MSGSRTVKGGIAYSALFLVLLWVLGCGESLKEVNPIASKVDVDKQLEALSAEEQVNDYGLYDFNYTSGTKGNIASLRFSKGILLVDDRGVFRYEQVVRDPRRSFLVYFDPESDFSVVFPKLKTAYKGSPALLSQQDTLPVLAAYDGIRVFLGLGNIWSNPSANHVESHPLIGTAEFQEPGRPYKWEVAFEENDSGHVIFKELKAKTGLTTQVAFRRKKKSIKSYDRSAWNSFVGSEDRGGREMTFTVWELDLAGSDQTAQIQITPYEKASITPEQVREQLKPPNITNDFQVKNLTTPLLKRWLNLR